MIRTRILVVDFDARLARLAVEPAPSGGVDHVRAIVAALTSGGMQRIEVLIAPALPAPAAAALRGALHDTGVSVCTGADEAAGPRRGNRAFQAPTSFSSGHGDPTLMFEVFFDRPDTALAASATVVAVVCLAAGMEPLLAGRLRFLVHELNANTADHADFAGNAPRIELSLAANRSAALVSYRDNSRPFTTTAFPVLDIGGKIARGERRGLGLYMVNRMSRTLQYRRNGEWNESVILLAGAEDMNNPERSKVMHELELEEVPCRIANTVVLKPVGSIDSTTVHIMDARLGALEAQNGLQVVLDMSSVEFISSAGVGLFLGTASRLRSSGGDLVFADVPAAVLDVFDIINLSTYFKIVGSVAELQATTR